MEWIVTLVYVIGALITHYIIYRNKKEENIEAQTANLTSLLWPVALCICLILFVEGLIKNTKELENNQV